MSYLRPYLRSYIRTFTSSARQLQASTLLLICLSLTTTASQAAAEIPQLYTATYKSRISGLTLTATRQLRQLDSGLLELRFSASSWFASIDEFSQFSWGENGLITPQRYEYHRTGLGRDRHAVLTFDHNSHTVVNDVQNRPWTLDIPPATQDKLSYQMQLRSDLMNDAINSATVYQVADGGKLKEYGFEVLGEETVTTPAGTFQTLKVQRIRHHDAERITYLWLAPERDYLLIRLLQHENDGKDYEINLANVTYQGLTQGADTPTTH